MDTHTMNSNVRFPDISFYDLSKAGDMALYLAHCDLYPFKSVIENNHYALKAIGEAYFQMSQEASRAGDFVTEDWAMTGASLHSTRVTLFTEYSLLLSLVAILEEAVNTLCRVYQLKLHLDVSVEQTKGFGLERAAKYLKEKVGIRGFTGDSKWEYITTIRDARNMVVHNGGRIVKDFEKYDKFGIGYYKEDNKLYLQSSDIEKFYDAIMEFIERSFRLEPQAM